MTTSPDVGGNSPTTIRADGGFSGTGFADQCEGLAFGDVETDVVDGFQKFQMPAFEDTVEPRLGDVEDAAQVFDFDKGLFRHAAVSAVAAS